MGVEPTLDSPTAEQTVLKTARPTGARAPPRRRGVVRQTRAAIPSPPPPTRPARREASRAPRAAQRDRSARLSILDAPAPREDRGRDAEATPRGASADGANAPRAPLYGSRFAADYQVPTARGASRTSERHDEAGSRAGIRDPAHPSHPHGNLVQRPSNPHDRCQPPIVTWGAERPGASGERCTLRRSRRRSRFVRRSKRRDTPPTPGVVLFPGARRRCVGRVAMPTARHRTCL